MQMIPLQLHFTGNPGNIWIYHFCVSSITIPEMYLEDFSKSPEYWEKSESSSDEEYTLFLPNKKGKKLEEERFANSYIPGQWVLKLLSNVMLCCDNLEEIKKDFIKSHFAPN